MSRRWRTAALALPIALALVLGSPILLVITVCFAYWAICSRFPR